MGEGGAVTIRPMEQTDIPAALRVWQETSARGRSVETPEGLARYLAHNPELSQVAEQGGHLIGVLVGGHDGRRGFLHHVGVLAPVRRHGVARGMVDCYMAALKEQGIVRFHLMVRQSNAVGLRFWRSYGCRERANTVVISLVLSTDSQDSGGNG
jgi:ribosomal protein S18 acetylase RimI-like enzyme